MPLYDSNGKQVVVADGKTATSAAASGLVMPRKGERVTVVGNKGEVVDVDAESFHSAIGSGYYRVATDEERAKEAMRNRLEGGSEASKIANPIIAGELGVTRGGAGPVGDATIKGLAYLFGGEKAAHETSRYLRDLKDYYKAQSIGGEVAGFAASLLWGAGGKAAGGAAKAAEAASGAGKAAEAAGAVGRAGEAAGAASGAGKVAEAAAAERRVLALAEGSEAERMALRRTEPVPGGELGYRPTEPVAPTGDRPTLRWRDGAAPVERNTMASMERGANVGRTPEVSYTGRETVRPWEPLPAPTREQLDGERMLTNIDSSATTAEADALNRMFAGREGFSPPADVIPPQKVYTAEEIAANASRPTLVSAEGGATAGREAHDVGFVDRFGREIPAPAEPELTRMRSASERSRERLLDWKGEYARKYADEVNTVREGKGATPAWVAEEAANDASRHAILPPEPQRAPDWTFASQSAPATGAAPSSLRPTPATGAPPPAQVPVVAVSDNVGKASGLTLDQWGRLATPTSAMDLVGGHIERVIYNKLGKGFIGKVGGGAARGAFEGGAMGAMSEIDEQILGDEKVNAKKILAAVGTGALMGATLGGAGSGLVHGLGSAGSMIRKKAAAHAFESIAPTSKMRKEAIRIFGSVEAAGEELMSLVSRGGKTSEGVDAARQKFASVLKDGDAIFDKLSAAGIMSSQGNAIGVEQAFNAREAIKTGRVIIDGEVHDATNLKRMYDAHVVNADGGVTFLNGGAAQRDIRTLLEYGVAPNGPKDARAWRDFRVLLDDRSKWQKVPMPGRTDEEVRAYRELRDIVEATHLDIMGRQAEQLGIPNIKSEYVAWKKAYQKAKFLKDAMERFETHGPKQFASDLTQVWGLASLIHGHPGSLVASLIARGAKSVADERKLGISKAIHEVSSIGELQKAVREVDEHLTGGVEAFFAGSKPKRLKAAHPVMKTIAAERKLFETRTKLLEDVQAAPLMAAASVERGLGATKTVAPNHFAATSAAQSEAIKYLLSVRPAPRMGALGAETAITDRQIRQFNEKWDAIDNPVDTITHGLHDGSLTPDKVAAIKAVYPPIYERAVGAAMAGVAKGRTKGMTLPRARAVYLGTLLEQPIDSTVRMSTTFQAVHAGKRQGGGQVGVKAAPSPVGASFGSLFATDAEKRSRR